MVLHFSGTVPEPGRGQWELPCATTYPPYKRWITSASQYQTCCEYQPQKFGQKILGCGEYCLQGDGHSLTSWW